MGTNYTPDESECVIPRSINDIFDQIEAEKSENTFTVTTSFIELYQQQLYDLLTEKNRKDSILDIREYTNGIKIVGITEHNVKNTEEALELLAQGSKNRATAATAMNHQSSRSHTIFTITIHQIPNNNPDNATTAKFHLVDLAGSGRSKKTRATGERFRKGVNINEGLLALGNVISQLGAGKNAAYVSYRDSKLTRLLQDSLGGNSITLMIACVSPADYNLDETLNTLRYADRVKQIKNKPIVNQDPKEAEINRLIKMVNDLRLQLMSQGGSTSLSYLPEHADLVDENENLDKKKLAQLAEKLNVNMSEDLFMNERAGFDLQEMEAEIRKLQAEKEELVRAVSTKQRQLEQELVECNKKLEVHEQEASKVSKDRKLKNTLLPVIDYRYDFEDSINRTVNDNTNKDPDWDEQLDLNKPNSYNTSKDKRKSKKRSAGDVIKCACKTKCSTRLCSCRRNGKLCYQNCSCEPELCENRDKENRRTYLEDVTNNPNVQFDLEDLATNDPRPKRRRYDANKS